MGMDLRCAGARSPEELWTLLSDGDVATRAVPVRRRFFTGPLEDTRPHWAGLLDDVDQFDAPFFGISPREADLMDPQLRLFLQVAWGALEDANAVAPAVDPDTGVFAGVMYDDYAHHANHVTRAAASPYKSWESFSLANRLSQVLGLRGPSLVVDTACSSSGTALHLACRALLDGDCRQAIVGGVNLILDPDRFAQLGRLGILSATGRCLAFGQQADGTLLGEGVGVVVLRRLDEALQRGDRVYGIIKGTGVSTGSGTVGFTAPNPQAQAVAIRRAVEVSGVEPRSISYIETHGTATLLGDPIEVRGLTLGYGVEEGRGPARASIGSIKPNIGHLEAGAAVMSLIKVLLQLHHRVLLPSVTSPEPNPQIPFAHLPFTIQRERAPWPSPDGGPRRAAMSSFGVGGANVHVVLEEAPGPAAETPATGLEPRQCELLTLSARSETSLRAYAGDLRDWLPVDDDVSLADVAHTLNATRRAFEQRAAIVAGDVAALRSSLDNLARGEADGATVRASVPADAKAPAVAFLFTGQGSQYHGMGRRLYATQPVFRGAIDECASHLDARLGVSLVGLLHGDETEQERGRLDQTRFTQPALFAIEYALARLWQSWGVQPAAVVGHSVGEFAAMCIAGGLSLADAARLIEARGRLMQALPTGGVMVSVAAPEARVREAMAGAGDRVSVAGVNSPQQTVISGERAAVDDVVVALTAAGIRTRPLTVSHAFHSALMRPMIEAFEAELRDVAFQTPTIPIVSCVDGVIALDAMSSPAYWTRQVLEPVRFLQAMGALQAAGIGAYLEIGPQPVLTTLGRQCLGPAGGDAVWLPSIRRDADEWQTLLASAGQLHLAGVALDWNAVSAPVTPSFVSLPRYAFDTRPHWVSGVADTRETRPSSARLSDARAYGIEWQAVPLSVVPPATDGTWLILGAVDPASDALVEALASAGAHCVRVAPDFRADRQSLTDLLETHAPVTGILHLRGLDAPGAGRVSVAALDRWREHALDTALAAAQSVAGRDGPRLFVVTRGAVPAGPDAALSLPQSTLWGLGRTVALEYPGAWGGLVDLPGGVTGEADMAAAAAVILTGGVEDQVAVRDGAALGARLVPQPLSKAPRFAVHGDAAYLVTGGMGALGLHVARWLADSGARHLVLVGRHVRESGAVEALRGRGVSVDLVEADVADSAHVDALLAHICSGAVPLRGVVHAAGVDIQRPLSDITSADLAAALSAKMAGAWLLHDRTRDLSLDFFVGFSSLASVLGSTGRAAYAAANAFLDALAIERRRLGLAALTVNWGPWAGDGMAAEGETGAHFAAIGNHLLDPADALPILEALIGSNVPQAIVADIEWPRFAAAYQSRRARPIIANLLPGAGGAGVGRVGPPSPVGFGGPGTTGPASDGRDGSVDGRAGTVDARAGTVDGRAGSPSPAHGPAADIARQVREEVAQVLGFRNVDDVPLDRGFFEMGLDSLSSVELATRLEARFGVPCRGFVFDTPTVGLLGERLARDLAGMGRAGSPNPAEGGNGRAGSPLGAPKPSGEGGSPAVDSHGRAGTAGPTTDSRGRAGTAGPTTDSRGRAGTAGPTTDSRGRAGTAGPTVVDGQAGSPLARRNRQAEAGARPMRPWPSWRPPSCAMPPSSSRRSSSSTRRRSCRRDVRTGSCRVGAGCLRRRPRDSVWSLVSGCRWTAA